MLFQLCTLLLLIINTSCSGRTISVKDLGLAYVNDLTVGYLVGNKYEICYESLCKRVDQYLGIRYAYKPQRFEKAKLYTEQQKGVFQNKPPACWQYVPRGGFEEKNAAAKIWLPDKVSEDCHFLNVWAPSGEYDKMHTVMVWIFGGGFFSGSAALDVYDGRVLAGFENVVVASMQYRVGAFGFLFKPPSAQGNMGLFDQQLALEWIYKNIKPFGGNPQSITIFGESAGSASVGFHYLNAESRKYFNRAIMQSASPFNRWALSSNATGEEIADAFIELCKCHYESSPYTKVECLRKKSADELETCYWQLFDTDAKRRGSLIYNLGISTMSGFMDGTAQYFNVLMRPVIDGKFVKDCPTNIISDFKSDKAPEILIGNVDKEGMYWLFYGLSEIGVQFLKENGQVYLPTIEQLKNRYFNYTELLYYRFLSSGHMVKGITDAIKNKYGLSEKASVTNIQFLQQLDYLSGDMDFTCGTVLFADLMSRVPNSKIWMYDFMHKSSLSPFPYWTGAMHGYEIEYNFGMPMFADFRNKYYGFTYNEEQLSMLVIKYWANFAKTGNPNSQGSKEWLPYKSDVKSYLEIDISKRTNKNNLRGDACQFWNVDFNKTMTDLLKGKKKACPNMEQNVLYIMPLRFYIMQNVG